MIHINDIPKDTLIRSYTNAHDGQHVVGPSPSTACETVHRFHQSWLLLVGYLQAKGHELLDGVLVIPRFHHEYHLR